MPNPYLRWMGENGRQEVYLLTADQTLIGRSSGTDLRLTEHSVSRHHARIIRGDEGFSILDLESSHGTYVNGKKIQQQCLQHGDRIRLGQDGLDLFFTVDDTETTRAQDLWEGEQIEQSLQNLATILPSHDSGYTDLERISCVLDFHYYWGKNFSPELTFQQILKSALEISGAERGFILLKKAEGFHYEVGMDAQGALLSQSDFRTSQSVVRRVSQEGVPVVMTEGIGGDFAKQESILAMHLRAVACLPLQGIPLSSDEPEVLGILYLDSTRKMHALSGIDEKILHKLAEQAGNVLEKLEMIKGLEERKKIDQDLALAQETQRSLLPRFLPEFENFRIHAFSHPTRFVGGDFYDFLPLPSGGWACVLADVSGKGMPAALLSSLLQGALGTEFRAHNRPEEALNRVNLLLCDKSLPSQFATLFLFLVEPDGKAGFISAGHNPVYLFRAATGQIEELVSDSLILGAFPFAKYQSRPFELHCGDILVVYSDGLTEAENPEGEMFGEARLREIMQREGPAGSEVLEKKLLAAIAAFTRGHGQTDDITFVVVHKHT